MPGSESFLEQVDHEPTEEAILYRELDTYFRNEERMRHIRGQQTEESKNLREELIQFQHLVEHYVIEHSDDPEALEKFWQYGASQAEHLGLGGAFKAQRMGMLTEVAARKALRHIGMRPATSTPRENRDEKIDLWVIDSTPVQIKGRLSGNIKVIDIKEFQEGLRPKERGYTRLLVRHAKKFQHHVIGLQDQNSSQENPGYLIAIPHQEFDPVNGEPSENLVQVFERYFQDKGLVEEEVVDEKE